MNWTQTEAAEWLEISRGSVELYEKGRRREDGRPVEIPTAIALACAALEMKHSETDNEFLKRLTMTTTRDGLPTHGEAERYRAFESEAFARRVMNALRGNKKPAS